MTVSIIAVGVAAPSLRLPAAAVNEAWGRGGGRGHAAVCGPDEDVLTLSWAAAQRALDAADITADSVDGLYWGTSRPPFAEGPSWTHLAATLSLGSSGIDGSLHSGSTHAGIEALVAASDAVASGRRRRVLVVTADAILPATGTPIEAAAGAAAAALVLEQGEGPAELRATNTAWLPVLDRYRGDREPETRDAYDPRLFREEVFLPLLTEVGKGTGAGETAAWALPDPDGRLGKALAKRLGLDSVASGSVRAELGDCGAAAPLVGAAGSLRQPGSVIALGYGGGRATAVSIDVRSPVPGADDVAQITSSGRTADYTEVLRAREVLKPTGESVEMAVPPGSAMFVRGNSEVLGLVGARCVDCDTVNTPPSIHPVCIACGGDRFELVSLARTGTVQTFVINHTMPAPFVAPLPLVVVDLDDGSRIQLQGTGTGADIEIGSPVHLELRRYTVERGVPIYGWKVSA